MIPACGPRTVFNQTGQGLVVRVNHLSLSAELIDSIDFEFDFEFDLGLDFDFPDSDCSGSAPAVVAAGGQIQGCISSLRQSDGDVKIPCMPLCSSRFSA